jgi:hypothetical protein
MEKRLHRQQNNVSKHKRYFMTLINRHRVVLVALFLPAFIWGWRRGGRGFGGKLKQLFKFGMVASVSLLKSQLLLAVKRSVLPGIKH